MRIFIIFLFSFSLCFASLDFWQQELQQAIASGLESYEEYDDEFEDDLFFQLLALVADELDSDLSSTTHVGGNRVGR